jgi:hypothetical protein
VQTKKIACGTIATSAPPVTLERRDLSRHVPSSTLLGRVGVGALAGVAGAGPDGQERLKFAEDGVESQAGAGAFGSYRNCVQKAWASEVRVTWRCQPV